MSDKTKYSSFKNQQTITENFRKYVNEVGYYGLGMDGAPPESPEDRYKELANLAVQSGDEKKIKGYTLALKHIGRYGFNKDGFNKDGFDGISRQLNDAPSKERNEGWKKALQDWDDSEAETFSDFGQWLGQGDDHYGHYEDEDDREYADFQDDDDDYTRSEGKSQQTITENFRRFIKEDAWKDGHMEKAWKYLDMSYNYSLGGHYRDDLIIMPKILAQYMMEHKEKDNFAAKIAEIATEELDLGTDTGRSQGPTEFTWPEKHKEATLAVLKNRLDGDKYAIAEEVIMNLENKIAENP